MAQQIAGAHGITCGGFNDKGYTLTEIDLATGQQKLPFRRFDDDGVSFSSNTSLYTIDLTDPAQRQNSFIAVGLNLEAYSQKSSGIRPFDADILEKKLGNWKVEARTGLKREEQRACAHAARHEKLIFQRKNKQCQHHMVIVRSEKYSNTRRQLGGSGLAKLGGGV